MWSLYEKKEDDTSDFKNTNMDEGGLSSYLSEGNSEELLPLKFSNGKTQADIVKEVLEAIKAGNKIIFIKGVCGSGKSAIALNIARHFSKTSIVVPIKSLQEQYEEDYANNKFILKENKEKLKISVIKGRNNFSCGFAEENLSGFRQADDFELPCVIELREKNMKLIQNYIELNPDVDKTSFSSVSDVRRMSVAPACNFWSPLLPADVKSKALEKAKKRTYVSCSGVEYAWFLRKKGCGYYDQYVNYIDADVLIFNSRKYILETLIGRRPKTDIEIIDECDEFLDSFANEKTINLSRLLLALSGLFPDTNEKKQAIKEMIYLVNNLSFDSKKDEIGKIEDGDMYKLMKLVLDNPYLAEEEEINYYNAVFEIIKEFEGFLDETYVSFTHFEEQNKKLFDKKEIQEDEKRVFANLVTINLAKRFKELVDMSNALVLMSGTLHSEEILRDIFGLDNFLVIEAETKTPGKITKYRTGLERNCKYANFQQGLVTREFYLKSLNACVANASFPALVHINSFADLPTELEKAELKLNNLISKEKLINTQMRDKNSNEISKFKSGVNKVLFTTKCSRGVDFPGDLCKSVILTKYPYPNKQALFWQILKQEKPEQFFGFYMDKARRELLQKIYRALRFEKDHVYLLSPDLRVLEGEFE